MAKLFGEFSAVERSVFTMASDALPNRSTILLVGSAGFIGSHLSERLAEQGHHVRGFDLQVPAQQFGTTSTVAGDVRQVEDLCNALPGIDTVIHLAAVHFDFGHADQEYFDTNEGGMRALLTAMSRFNVRRLIFISSIAVYGDYPGWADEETPPAPETAYGASKLAAETLVQQWGVEDPARCVVILRPCAVYGERNVSNMMNLIRQIHSGYFVLFGSGRNVKATAYVGNLTSAVTQQLDQLSCGVRTFNYADKPDLTVDEIVTTIRLALGKKSRPLRLPLWLGLMAAFPFELITRLTGRDLPVSTARVRKLNRPTQVHADRIRAAGFRQQISSKEGLQRMVAHFLAEPTAWPSDFQPEDPRPQPSTPLSEVSHVKQNESLNDDSSHDSFSTVHTRR
jgi:nucleoside-diphosphate-sugar epimerase